MVHNGTILDPSNGTATIIMEQDHLLFYEGDEIKAACEIQDRRPSANMSWAFSPVPDLTKNNTRVGDIHRINLSLKANRTMDQHMLSCKVNHFALSNNTEKVTNTDNITIYCKHHNYILPK